jgi:hypothetical protein
MINRSFQLLRTNPALTTNVKLIVNSDYKLYLESFDTNKQLLDEKFKHFSISKNHLYEEQVVNFYDGLASQLAFDIKYDSDDTTVFTTYDKQFDDIYWGGAKAIEDDWHQEDYEYFAPLFIRKGVIPEGFVILRVDEATPYEETDNEFNVTKLTKDNFYTQIVDRWKCVDFRDMRYQSDFGYFLSNNFIENSRYPERSFDLNFKQYEYSKFYGIDYKNGVYVSKSKFLQDTLYYEQPHFKLEKEILNSYKDNDLIFPHILNIKFLFNDVPSTPDDVRMYSMNRYYGFYIDKLEFITNLTSYITPEIKPGFTLKNNIFMNGGVESIESPFVEGFDADKTYWIQYQNDFYQVVKVLENGKYLYKIMSDFDMSGVTLSSVNDRTCFINYEEGYNYRCRTISNPSGYTNFISGLTSNFKIDPYFENGQEQYMFGDLYLIEIDGKYHVLKKRDGNYFVQSDYAINSYPEVLEYWKGGKDSKYYKILPVYQFGQKPLVYPVYRIKFSDIKDFDFNIVNTHFSDFEYEKDVYHATPEHKLYAVDYNDISVLDKEFMTHARGEDGQYQIMNVSSEYVADDELYEIAFNDLTDIWRKNQSVVKWGFAGSNSNCDYPYKLNNSIDVGDIFNRTTNIKDSMPTEIEKNLEYFYRIGNFFSGYTSNIVRYLNQSTNIEVDFMANYSKKFNLNLYLNSNIDYFDYFFKNKMYFTVDDVNYIKPTIKYSTFQGGDQYTQSNTLFKGLNINIASVNSISRDISGKITNIIINNNTFNNYKFAIILNDVYYYYNGSSTTVVGINEGGLSGNTVIDKSVNGIHVFLNDKFKNVLIVINVRIPMQQSLISLNNIPVFNEKYGLYNSRRLDGKSLIWHGTGTPNVKQFESELISGANFINAFDDFNSLSEFDSGITFYYVNQNGQSGCTGPINIFKSGNTMSIVSGWTKADPPFILTINDPEVLETKKQSYIKGSIKGPKTNIYGKYRTYYDEEHKQKINIVDPLARYMNLNIQDKNKNVVYVSNKVSSPNLIYRFNGSYEPIFRDIALFNSQYLYQSGLTLMFWDSNYKFDTTYENFGSIEELIFSKVNPTISPLKLKNSTSDKSIYPMVDEFGYQFNSRFIFNSCWDSNFYIVTTTNQNVNKRSFSTLGVVENLVAPVQNQNQE